MSGFSNFAVSFSIISILAGAITSYSIALRFGGPSAINLGWPIVGVLVIVATFWLVPTSHQSLSWTMTGWHNGTGSSFAPYVFLMGLLMAQYTYTGYDASAHVAEETRGAALAAPKGIVMSVVISIIGRWVSLFSITAAIQDSSATGIETLLASPTSLPPAQIFLDALNNPVMAKFLRRLNKDFVHGPWHLGKWSAPIGWIAVVWVIFICILFVLPPLSPITVDTFNYSPIAVIAVAILATILWITKGRHHFMTKGEIEHLTVEDPDKLLM